MIDITNFLAFTIDGLARGVVFALLGLSITLVFGLGGVLNLAVGAFAVIAVIIVSLLLGLIQLPVAIILSLIVLGIFAITIDRTLLSLVYRSEGEERILLGIFVTLGLLLVLEGLLFVFFPDSYSLPLGLSAVSLGGVIIRASSLVVISLSVITFLLFFIFFSKTSLGLATKTVLQDETGAILCGVNPRRVQSLIFVLSLVCAGFAGILYSITFSVDAGSSMILTIYAIITSIVGGVTSITGTVIAGIFLGLVATYTSAYIGAYIAEVTLFLIVVIVLLIRPQQIQ